MNNEELNQVPVQPEQSAPVVPNPVPVAPVAPTPQPVPQTQINPTATIADATEIPTVEAGIPAAPKAEAPVFEEPKVEPAAPAPTPVSAPVEVEEPKEDISDVASTTFDYNALYGIQKSEEEIAKEEQLDVVDKPMFTASEIVIESPTITNRTSEDVVPEFNINALDENANSNAKTTDSAMNDDEKDKAETRRALTWIIVLTLLLVVFVGFIFPIIAK